MKKTYILITMAAIAAVACNKEVLTPATDEKSGEEIVVTRGTRVSEITGLLEEKTKSAYELDTDETGSPILHTYWTSGDQIAVTDGESTFVYRTESTASSAETAANFAGDGIFELENGLWAIYPSTALVAQNNETLTVGISNAIEQDAEGKFDHWGNNDVKLGYGSDKSDVPSIHFKNLLATLKVNLKLAADHGINFGQNETVKSVTLTAVGNEKMAGDFTLPLSPSASELTPTANTFSEITCIMQEDTELSTDYTTSLYFSVAPGAYTQILVTIQTSIRTIQRAVNINTNLERNHFYNINLTKIKNADPYSVIVDIPVPEGGWGDDTSTASRSSGAVIALWDGVYDDTQIGRYYTIQLAKDKIFTNIVETTNIQITYSDLYTDESHLADGRVTFCGLEANTRYFYRVKVMGVSDEYYSVPNTFITTARFTAHGKKCGYYIDFDKIVCYGTGDFMGRAVGTYPEATPLSVAGDADWNDRLGFVSTSENYQYWSNQPAHAASYKVGSSYHEMLIGLTGNPNTAITYSSGTTLDNLRVTNIEKVYNRPGYIQLGTTTEAGSFKVAAETSKLGTGKTLTYTIKFKACAYNKEGNSYDAAVKVNLYAKSSAAVWPCEIEGENTITIPYDSSYTWKEYSVTITTNAATDGLYITSYNYPAVITISTTANSNGNYVRVFMDDVQITKN